MDKWLESCNKFCSHTYDDQFNYDIKHFAGVFDFNTIKQYYDYDIINNKNYDYDIELSEKYTDDILYIKNLLNFHNVYNEDDHNINYDIDYDNIIINYDKDDNYNENIINNYEEYTNTQKSICVFIPPGINRVQTNFLFKLLLDCVFEYNLYIKMPSIDKQDNEINVVCGIINLITPQDKKSFYNFCYTMSFKNKNKNNKLIRPYPVKISDIKEQINYIEINKNFKPENKIVNSNEEINKKIKPINGLTEMLIYTLLEIINEELDNFLINSNILWNVIEKYIESYGGIILNYMTKYNAHKFYNWLMEKNEYKKLIKLQARLIETQKLFYKK